MMYKEPKKCLGFCFICKDRVYTTNGLKEEKTIYHSLCKEKNL